MHLSVAVSSLVLLISSITAQVIVPSYSLIPPSTLTAPAAPAHPAVVENAIAESQLPPELLNPFYKNPAIAAGLAKESWFTNKEFPVHHREADKIPRSEIAKIITRLQHRR